MSVKWGAVQKCGGGNRFLFPSVGLVAPNVLCDAEKKRPHLRGSVESVNAFDRPIKRFLRQLLRKLRASRFRIQKTVYGKGMLPAHSFPIRHSFPSCLHREDRVSAFRYGNRNSISQPIPVRVPHILCIRQSFRRPATIPGRGKGFAGEYRPSGHGARCCLLPATDGAFPR